MRIRNLTHWRTDQMAAILRRVASDELDPARRRRFTVHIIYGRRRGAGVSGYALYHSSAITLKLSRQDGPDSMSFAHTAAHEFAHARGVRHQAMRGSTRYTYAEGWQERVAWARAIPIEIVPATPKLDTHTRLVGRIAHAEQMVMQWERKLKRGQTALKAWRTKLARQVRAMRQRQTLATTVAVGPPRRINLTDK